MRSASPRCRRILGVVGRHGAGFGGGRHPFWKTTTAITRQQNETTRSRRGRTRKRVNVPGIGDAGDGGPPRAVSAWRRRASNHKAQSLPAANNRNKDRSQATKSTGEVRNSNAAGRPNPVPGVVVRTVGTDPGRRRVETPRARRAVPASNAPGVAYPASSRTSAAPSCRTSSRPNIVAGKIRTRTRAEIVALGLPSRTATIETGRHATRPAEARRMPRHSGSSAGSSADSSPTSRTCVIDRRSPTARTGRVVEQARARRTDPAGPYVAPGVTMKRRTGSTSLASPISDLHDREPGRAPGTTAGSGSCRARRRRS